MVTIAALKSLIAWIWTWVINDWIVKDGMMTVFMVIASLNVAVYGTTFVLYLKGKAIRIWLHDIHLMRRTGLE
jgi:hypothetical protein